MKKNTKILFVIALNLIIIFIFFQYRYKISIEKSNRDWYEKQYVEKAIKGTLKSISEFNGNPHKVILGIQNNKEEFEITYGVTCVDKMFRDFVQVGDSVFKIKGEKTLLFCKINSNCKEFELNFCDKW